MKVRSKGYLVVYDAFSQWYHYESKSRGYEDTPEKQLRFKGERRLKALLMDKDCSFRIARSDRLLIIREKLEEFIDSSTEL